MENNESPLPFLGQRNRRRTIRSGTVGTGIARPFFADDRWSSLQPYPASVGAVGQGPAPTVLLFRASFSLIIRQNDEKTGKTAAELMKFGGCFSAIVGV